MQSREGKALEGSWMDAEMHKVGWWVNHVRGSMTKEPMRAACRLWRMIEVDKCLEDVDAQRGRLLQLLAPAGTVMDLNIGAALWFAVEADGKLRSPADTALSPLDGQRYVSQVRKPDTLV